MKSAIFGFAAMCLVLAFGVVTDRGATGVASDRHQQQQVALNPQPLPPGDEHDPWGFDAG